MGDLAAGAFYTLLGSVIHMNIYPANW